jgi:hypothetical protein
MPSSRLLSFTGASPPFRFIDAIAGPGKPVVVIPGEPVEDERAPV